MALHHAERVAEVVDLVAQRGGLELIDDGIALELSDRLQGAIERIAHRFEIALAEFARAGRRFARGADGDLGQRLAEETLASLQAFFIGGAPAMNAALTKVMEGGDGGQGGWQTERRHRLAGHAACQQSRTEPHGDGRHYHAVPEPGHEGQVQQAKGQRQCQHTAHTERRDEAAARHHEPQAKGPPRGARAEQGRQQAECADRDVDDEIATMARGRHRSLVGGAKQRAVAHDFVIQR
jgi:hypothetical protein